MDNKKIIAEQYKKYYGIYPEEKDILFGSKRSNNQMDVNERHRTLFEVAELYVCESSFLLFYVLAVPLVSHQGVSNQE